MKWLKDNLLKLLILIFIVVVVIFVADRFFKDSGLRKDLRESDERIQELDKDNREKDKTILESAKMARKAEAKVAEKEKIIEELMQKEEKVEEEVQAMPSIEVVLLTAEILGSPDGVRLQDNEVVFTLECAKKNLTILKRFPLVEQQRDEALGALQFQKMATFNVWRITLAQSWQISNWKEKYKEKDGQFSLAMKDRKKRWLDGLWKGFVAGVIVTVTLKLLLKK